MGRVGRVAIPPSGFARSPTNGKIDVRGAGIPGSIWHDYMVAALKTQRVMDFAKPRHVGDKPGNALPG